MTSISTSTKEQGAENPARLLFSVLKSQGRNAVRTSWYRSFLLSIAMLLFCCLSAEARTINVFASRSHGSAYPQFGSKSSTDFRSALTNAKSGDTILLGGGTYDLHESIWISAARGAANNVTIKARSGQKPVLDFSHNRDSGNQPVRSFRGWGLVMKRVNNWKIYDIEVKNAGNAGIKVIDSDNNRFERLRTHHNGGTGFSLVEKSSGNKVTNVDSHHNCDCHKNGKDADGFGVKEKAGRGNIFTGARAWNNSDDGFDFFRMDEKVEIKDSWAFENGFGNAKQGDGNGFKLGKGKGKHVVKNSAAWGNRTKGFDSNDNTGGVTVDHATSFNNKTSNFHLNTVYADRHLVKNSISLWGNSSGNHFKNNGKFTKHHHNSFDIAGVNATEADFLALRFPARGNAKKARRSGGRLPNLKGFLQLRANSDLRWKGTGGSDLGAFRYKSSVGNTPEPSSIVLMLLGSAVLASRRQRPLA